MERFSTRLARLAHGAALCGSTIRGSFHADYGERPDIWVMSDRDPISPRVTSMSVYLDVPFVTQLGFGVNHTLNDPTGCWYASCCMIAYHFEAGPRLGVPELYNRSSGHLPIGGGEATTALKAKGINTTSGGEEIMAKREGLEPVPDLATDRTLAALELLLRSNGPIYFAWFKTHGSSTYGHISVLIGTDDTKSQVLFHDPENAPNSRLSLADYNAKRMRGIYDMLRRKGVTSSMVRTKTA
jgi:hypothetical protein